MRARRTAPLLAPLALCAVAPAAASLPPTEGASPPAALVQRMRSKPSVERGFRRWIAAIRRARLAATGREDVAVQLQPREGTFVKGTRGFPVVPVLYANTSTAPYASSQLARQLFGSWPTGTLADLYAEMSYGHLAVTGEVHDWVRLSRDDSWYEDGALGLTDKLGDLLDEAFAGLDADVDLARFDNDGPDGAPNSGDDDGYVDFVVVVQPERGAECGGNENVWSHRFRYRTLKGRDFETGDEAASGGRVRIDDYVVLPARACDGPMVEIGAFAHELGHAFGLPDLYDPSGRSGGIGVWGLMGSGGLNTPSRPAHLTAWSKAYLGWARLEDVDRSSRGHRLPPIEVKAPGEAHGVALRVFPHGKADTGRREYFVLENRQRLGFDLSARCAGLLVWHVDERLLDQRIERNEVVPARHQPLDLEEADGKAGLDRPGYRGGTADCFPGTGDVRLFSDGTTPGALTLDGKPSGIVVRFQGRETDGTLLLDVLIDEEDPAKAAAAPPVSEETASTPPQREGEPVGEPGGGCAHCSLEGLSASPPPGARLLGRRR